MFPPSNCKKVQLNLPVSFQAFSGRPESAGWSPERAALRSTGPNLRTD
jgi:hypothetical protein